MPTAPGDRAAAWGQPATSAACRRRTRSSLIVAVVGVALLVGFLWAVSYFDDRSQELRSSGTRTAGQVVSIEGGDGRYRSGGVTVAYRVGDRELRERVELGDDVSGYQRGQRVAVYYEPDDPTTMTIDDVANQPEWSVWVMIGFLVVGALALGGGGAAVARWRRARRILRRHGWSVESGRVVLDRRNRAVVTLDRDGERLLLRSPALAPVRIDGTGLVREAWADGELWLAGPDGRHGVLAQRGGAPLLCVHTPRTSRAARRWTANLSPSSRTRRRR